MSEELWGAFSTWEVTFRAMGWRQGCWSASIAILPLAERYLYEVFELRRAGPKPPGRKGPRRINLGYPHTLYIWHIPTMVPSRLPSVYRQPVVRRNIRVLQARIESRLSHSTWIQILALPCHSHVILGEVTSYLCASTS